MFTSNYRCLHTGVPYNTAYGWNRPNGKAQSSLFTYTQGFHTCDQSIQIMVSWVRVYIMAMRMPLKTA